MMRRRTLTGACALLVASGVGVVLAPVAQSDPAVSFLPPMHLTAAFPYGLVQAEPTIKIAPSGEMYVIAPGSTPIGCELWTVAPDGKSFAFHDAPDLGLGGGDCDLAITAPMNGSSYSTVAYSSLTLPDITTGVSTDGGQTFNTPNPAASQIVGDDRMWNGAADGNTVYMSYHILASNNIAVSVSTDGGYLYTQRGLAIDANHIAQAAYNNELGPIVVDTAAATEPKPVYTIFTAPRDVAENLNTAAGSTQTDNDAVFLATSTDGGWTWTDTPIYVGDGTDTYDHIFPALSIDPAGGLWAAWAGMHHVFASYRPAGSLTWTPPQQIDSSGNTANVFPWIAAGAPGRADMVWYSGTGTDYNDPTNQWTVSFAQLVAKPYGLDVTTQLVSSHVIHYGQICTEGVACSTTGNRALLDFFTVALTPDGRAAIAYADDSASAGAAQIYVAVQCAGTSAYTGSTLPDTC